MKVKLIYLLLFIISCKSGESINGSGLEVCKKDILIVDSPVIKQIEEFFEKENFYQEDSSQYYMYEIVLDAKLRIKDVNTVFKNNQGYSEQLKKLLKKLTFEKIDNKKSCNEYIVPFIINARLKKLIYPKEKTFYDINLPKE